MLAIMRRELKAYFTSMLGYVFFAMMVLLGGVMFFMSNLVYPTASLTNFFASVISWTIFVLPLLTMRLFAEDRKLKCDQLLICAPISITEMVLGKYLGAVLFMLVPIAVYVLFPMILAFFGNVPVAETISCFCGFVLFCCTIVAIGALMSSLTESQVIAAISTYAVIIVLVFLSSLSSAITNELLARLFIWVSPLERFLDFSNGILNFESVVYYLSFIALMLLFTVRVYEKRRYN